MNWATMTMELLGGLAVFLYGMDQMATALKKVAGDRMKGMLAAVTDGKVRGITTGVVATMATQSSSVTTVMLVGFTSAGLMNLSQTLAVILGADIGGTITAQLAAFKVTKYALVLVAGGFLTSTMAKQEATRLYSLVVMGLGLVFLGMGIMSEGMNPLRSYDPFIALMGQMSSPLYGILIGAMFTALIQSSAATVVIVIGLAQLGIVSLEAGIALSLGANIGTCATAGLAAIGKPREAVQVAMAHVGFKIMGVSLMFPLIGSLAELVVFLSPVADTGLNALEAQAYEVPRQIANAHTIFNVTLGLVFLPFTQYFAKGIEWMLPPKDTINEDEDEELITIKLPESLLPTPQLALDQVQKKLGDVASIASKMIFAGMPALIEGNLKRVKEVAAMDDNLDDLYAKSLSYIRKINQQELTGGQTSDSMLLTQAASLIESAGDVVERDLVTMAEVAEVANVVISEDAAELLSDLTHVVEESFTDAVESICDGDIEAAYRVKLGKPQFVAAYKSAETHVVSRLTSDNPNRIATYDLESEVLEKLKSIYIISRGIAKISRQLDVNLPKTPN